MRFSYPLLPAEFEIPDDWWNEAGMNGFTPAGPSYASCDLATQIIPLREIEPPFRFPEHPKDFRGFDRTRLVLVLSGFVAGATIEPVPLAALPQPEFPPLPFCYRVLDGVHRFYASVAAGYACLPGKVI